MRVVLAEDHVLLAAGLELLLESAGFEVVAIAGDGPAFVAAVEAHAPDLVIVDVRLPPTFRDEGVLAAIEVRRRHPALPVLVLSQYVERQYAAELLSDERGHVGYLLKDRISRVRGFIDALHRIMAGGTVIDPEVVAQLLGPRPHDPLDRLTPRETEVLQTMAEGDDNAQIAERLVITENAVHKHIGSIFAKLDLPANASGHRRVHAVLAYLAER